MKKRKLPEFLQGTLAMTHGETMANWLTIHTCIQKMRINYDSLHAIRSMMLSEYNRKEGTRMDIVVRLYGKFNAMRVQLERTQL